MIGQVDRSGRSLIGLVMAVTAVALVGCSQSSGSTVNTSGAPGNQGSTPSPSRPTKSKIIHHGPRSQNKVAITLDADFSPSAKARVESGEYPKQVNQAAIDYLIRTQTPATIFATGMWAQAYAAEMKALAARPEFEFANHTWNHDAWTRTCYGLPYVGDDHAKRDSVQRTNQTIIENGGNAPLYARMPGLCQSKSDQQLLAAEGLRTVNTDVPASDAFAKDPMAAANKMLELVKPGSILILHLNGAPNVPVTAEMLKILVPGLKAKGLEPVTLSDLLGQAS